MDDIPQINTSAGRHKYSIKCNFLNHPLWKRTCFLISNLFAIAIFFNIDIGQTIDSYTESAKQTKVVYILTQFQKILQEKFSKINRKHSSSQHARVDFQEDWNLYIDIGVFYEHYEGSSQYVGVFFYSEIGFKYYVWTRWKTFLIWFFPLIF